MSLYLNISARVFGLFTSGYVVYSSGSSYITILGCFIFIVTCLSFISDFTIPQEVKEK